VRVKGVINRNMDFSWIFLAEQMAPHH